MDRLSVCCPGLCLLDWRLRTTRSEERIDFLLIYSELCPGVEYAVKRMSSPMITITQAASAKVKELLEEQGKMDHALRIFVRGMSCSGPAYGMALDNEPRDDDNTFEFDGVRILVDPMSAQYVEGAQVDYVDSLM